MKVLHTLLPALARRRAFARAQKQADDTIPWLRDAFLARLPGRTSPDKTDAVANTPCDRHWLNEMDRILGVSLAADIFGEIINADGHP